MSAVAKIDPPNGSQPVPLTPVPAAHMESMALVHMIERVARDPSVDLERMERLIAMKERMLERENKAAFNEAIAAAKAEIKPIARNQTGHNSKKYADMAATATAVDPILSKYGLGYRYRTTQGDRITVTCILFHRAGHQEEVPLSAPPDKTGNKNDIQAIGSTLTYLQRYSLFLALGLAAGKDDDGNAATKGEAITQDQVDKIRELLEAKGAPLAKFLKWAKVERIEDIPAKVYESCVEAINGYNKGA